MSRVAVVGTSAVAAEWAARFLAAGHDVTVTAPIVQVQVAASWPELEGLGLFPGASLARLRIANSNDDLFDADFVYQARRNLR